MITKSILNKFIKFPSKLENKTPLDVDCIQVGNLSTEALGKSCSSNCQIGDT